MKNRSVDFFDTQFRHQINGNDFVLNSVENAILPLLSGDVLDLGCGLGKLAISATMRGCLVTAVDASLTAVD